MTKRTKFLSFFLSICLIFSVFTFPHAAAVDEIIDGGTAQPIRILTPDEVPFALDFQAMRQAGHVDRLATQETLLNEVLFANNDGSLTSYYFGVPIKYVDSDGAIKDKDNTIVQRNDMKYTTAANDVKAVLPQNISDGVTLEYNDYTVRCIPYVNSDVSVMSGESYTAAEALAVLNTANPKANKVMYNSVFNNKSSIVYTPTFMGIKEDIILTEYTGNIFRFRIEANGLVPQVQQDGRILLNNAQNEAVFEISPIVLVDANGKICLNNSQSMTQLSDGAYLYTVTANEEFLTDESTAYPVAVDPSFTISYDCEDGIDAYTLCLGENSGYYQSEYLPVGNTYIDGSSVDEYRSFIQLPFMTSSFFSTNYQYATIEAVYLYLSASSTGSGSVSAHLVAPSSYTGTVSDNFARYVQTPIQSISSTTAWNDYFIDITDEAMLWKNGTATWNYPEIMLKSSGMHNFCSPYYFPEYAPCVSVRFYNTVQSIIIGTNNQTLYLNIGDTHTVQYILTPSTHLVDDIYWTSDEPSIAEVSSNGVITAIGSGKCTITATTAVGGYEGNVTVYVNEDFRTAPYFLKNVATNKYMDLEGASFALGTNIQQWDFHTGNQARWVISKNDEGYYTIRSVHTNLCIGVAGGSTVEGVRIQQLSGNPTSTSMQWFIYRSSNNNYVLVPRSNLEMAISLQPGSTANGSDLYQYEYTNDLDYRDEWKIYSLDFSVVHYYDALFSTEELYMDGIVEATQFTRSIFYDLFGVSFWMYESPSQLMNALTDQCPNHFIQECTDSICGTNCRYHHKNIHNIAAQLHDIGIDKNEIYVMWTDNIYGTYCEHDKNTGEHMLIDEDVLAVAYNDMPIIHVLCLDGDSEQQILACIILTLAHEMAHMFSMPEVYDIEGHDIPDGYCCIMEKFDKHTAYEFYESILYENVEPFCSSCKTNLTSRVYNKIISEE